EPTKDTTPTEPTKDTEPTEPTKDTTPTGPSIDNDDVGQLTWVQRKDISDGVPVIDKRQYMRFDLNSEADMIEFESDSGADAILNISRGGVQLSHNKKLKVGDVIPVKVKYGDLEIDANVKIVSATDVKAGGEFIDLDQATANKLLYLNLMLDETTNYAEANMKPAINTMHIQ
uniref:PilZ domain-containing protein n=1 Tax=Candidatus Scatousia sp. TaxID=3085663 RepID=UPI00402971CB